MEKLQNVCPIGIFSRNTCRTENVNVCSITSPLNKLHAKVMGIFSDDVLVVGCGNSLLSGQLYDSGLHKITNIDISKTVLDQV